MASLGGSSVGPTFQTLSEALASMNLQGSVQPGSTIYTIRGGRSFEIDGKFYDVDGPELGIDDGRYTDKDLCSYCRGITAAALASAEGYLHVPSFESLYEVGSHEKCGICNRIRTIIQSPGLVEKVKGLKNGKRPSPVRLKLVHPWEREGITGSCISLHIDYIEATSMQALFYVRCMEGDPAQNQVTKIRNLDHTGSSASADTLRTWYRKCTKFHQCSSPFTLTRSLQDERPKRLLQFSSSPDKSHCLTKANEAERLKGVPLDALPKTFREAITICLWLDIGHLWIDSLCIIQDSQEDWIEESKKMGGIYANSAITIAADAAKDSSGGCFNEKSKNQLDDDSKTWVARVTNKLPGWGDEESTFLIYPFSFGTGAAIPAIENSVLATRAWTFQERILPPRIVHCTSTQLFWECRQCYRAEDNIEHWQPDRIQTLPGLIKRVGNVEPWSYNARSGLQLLAERAILLWYKEIIPKHYSGRSLTYATDKLVAISGIARAIDSAMPPAPSVRLGNATYPSTQYLCGLWRSNIAQALVFFRDSQVNPGPPPHAAANPPKYHCPTWSWPPIPSRSIGLFSTKLAPPTSSASTAASWISAPAATLTVKRLEDDEIPINYDWLLDDAGVPVGFCCLDYDDPGITEVEVLLCFVLKTAQPALGYTKLGGYVLMVVPLGGAGGNR
ncbi:heterokaryon incompatibility protein-domain-containing protein [Podospora aff. communis PSN243]|uniref:Heterokaryon incompatibility protein-domain-containing protein n=1 Tax=Podospora aff. communis PSN243 TaxID=3040156 RepID=A0AAV9GR69_9PEZI|nr:heterokaryon incompatibility protein-domain-containing protein [Podospora aff. communis PSN243]